MIRPKRGLRWKVQWLFRRRKNQRLLRYAEGVMREVNKKHPRELCVLISQKDDVGIRVEIADFNHTS